MSGAFKIELYKTLTLFEEIKFLYKAECGALVQLCPQTCKPLRKHESEEMLRVFSFVANSPSAENEYWEYFYDMFLEGN